MVWQHVIHALTVYCPGNENVSLWLYTENWHKEHLFDWKITIRDEVKTRMCTKCYLSSHLLYHWPVVASLSCRRQYVWQRFIVTCGCASPPVIITHLLVSLPSLNNNHFVSSAQTIKNQATQGIITSFVWMITVAAAFRYNCMQEQSCSLCKQLAETGETHWVAVEWFTRGTRKKFPVKTPATLEIQENNFNSKTMYFIFWPSPVPLSQRVFKTQRKGEIYLHYHFVNGF